MKSENQDAKLIFGEALRLSVAAEREAYLDQACPRDQALRQEVESLLSAYANAGDFLNQTCPLPASDFLIERTGTMIGRYKLLQKIGEGGFGVVYMAEQVEPMQRKVALKIIKAGMDTNEVIARFEAERQALALMDHPNIAKVLDAGATEAGRPYFVMELVRGIHITDYCDQKLLSTAGRLRLFIRVCHAVQHAHQKGIIHRDLKPSNVLVTLHDGEPVPKIIDFGVAKALGQKLTGKTLFTGFAQMLGTPAYMSPEQAEMSGLDADTRSDIYSLGVLLYELLTGVTPFDKETLAKAALDEVRRIIRETEPSKPSTRLESLEGRLAPTAQQRHTEGVKLIQLVRGDLDWIVMKCLEKDRTRRYETTNALAQDIEHHLNQEPVTAAAPSALYLAGKFVRRHRASLATVTALVLLLVAGAVVSSWQAVRAWRAERIADQQWQKAMTEARRADLNAETEKLQRQLAEQNARKSREVLQFIQNMMTFAGDRYADQVTVVEVLDRGVTDAEQRFKDEPDARASVRYAIGYCYSKLGKWEHAAKLLESSLSERERIFGFAHPDTLDAARETASVAFSRGETAEATTLSLRIAQSTREAASQPKFAAERQRLRNLELWADRKLVQVYMEAGKLSEAKPLIEELLKASNANEFTNPNESGVVYSEAGELALQEGRPQEALQDFEAALRHNQTLLQQAWVGGLRGAAWLALGDYQQAEQLITNSLPTLQHRFGESHFRVQRAYRDLVQLYGAMNQPTKADEFLSRVIPDTASLTPIGRERLQQLALAQERIRLEGTNGGACLQRALARADLGQWNLVTEDFDQAIAQTNLANAAKTPDFASACLELAQRAFSATQHKTAERASREALRLFRQLEQEAPKQSQPSQGVGHSLWQLGDVLLATGRRDEAKQALEEALKVFEQAAARHPEVPYLRQEQACSHDKIGDFYDSAGKSEDAERQFRIATELYGALKKEFPTNVWYAQEEAFTHRVLAECLARAGRWNAADTAYSQAVSLHEKAFAAFPNEPDLKERLRATQLGFATFLDAQGKTAQAEALRLRAQDGPSPPSPPK
jgi:eukaryotic-like serine/threonine-protein kinase